MIVVAVSAGARELERTGRVLDLILEPAGLLGRVAGGRVQLALFVGIGGDLEGLLEEANGLRERPERSRSFRRPAQRDPSLRGDRVALGTLGLCLVGGHVVLGQGTGDALVVECLEVARGGKVQAAAVAAGQRPVRDLADEALDEAVLALLRRPRVDLEREHLAPHEVAQPRRDLLRGLAG